MVGIVQPRRFFHDRQKREHFVKLRQAWLAKSAGKELLIGNHYPATMPGRPYHGIPAWFPHVIAEDLRSLRGISRGEVLEVMFDSQKEFGLHAPGPNVWYSGNWDDSRTGGCRMCSSRSSRPRRPSNSIADRAVGDADDE